MHVQTNRYSAEIGPVEDTQYFFMSNHPTHSPSLFLVRMRKKDAPQCALGAYSTVAGALYMYHLREPLNKNRPVTLNLVAVNCEHIQRFLGHGLHTPSSWYGTRFV